MPRLHAHAPSVAAFCQRATRRRNCLRHECDFISSAWISLAVGQTLAERNEIIHHRSRSRGKCGDLVVLERMGAKFVWWKMRDDGCLHVEDLKPLLTSRTRLVACTLDIQCVGSIVDVRAAADAAHAAGAEIFSTAYITVRTARSTSRLSTVTTWCVRDTRFSRRNMGFMWGPLLTF